MTPRILFSAESRLFPEWRTTLAEALDDAGLTARIDTSCGDPASYDYVICSPGGPVRDFRSFTRLKAVLSMWAGVEPLITNPTITCPIARMVDPGMIEGMTEWVTGQVLRHHLHMDRLLAARPGEWLKQHGPPLARNRTVAILGLGELGSAAAAALARLGFRVTGWSRTPRTVPGIRCLSGRDELPAAIADAEIISLLLPHTPQTENIVDAAFLSGCRPGTVLLNSGRGALINDQDLLAALDQGIIANATLDVFREEPLPTNHPFWAHPKVSIWPHIASDTHPDTAAAVLVENIRRGESGEPFLHLVDRSRGY